MITVIIAVIVYAAFHLGAGHSHHRYRKAHGLRPASTGAPSGDHMRACGCRAGSGSATGFSHASQPVPCLVRLSHTLHVPADGNTSADDHTAYDRALGTCRAA